MAKEEHEHHPPGVEADLVADQRPVRGEPSVLGELPFSGPVVTPLRCLAYYEPLAGPLTRTP
jgi:hypothetical protein